MAVPSLEHLNLYQPLGLSWTLIPNQSKHWNHQSQKNKVRNNSLDWGRSVDVLELGGEGGDDGEGVTAGRLAHLKEKLF